MSNGTTNSGAAIPILTIVSDPQQLPVKGGATVLNTGDVTVTLSTDQVATAANSFALPPNGAFPIPASSGPLWASVSSGQGQVVVFNGVYNIVSPTVIASISGPVDVTVTNANIPVTGSVAISGTPNVNITGGAISISSGTVDIGTVTGNVAVENTAGGVLLTGDLLESLASGILPATTGTGPFTSTVALNNLPHSYGALMVRITPGAGSQTWLAIAAAVAGKPNFSTGCPPQPNAVTSFTIIVPFANAQGDNAVMTFFSQIAGLSCTYAIFGLTSLGNIGVRGDGRAFPMGTLQLVTGATAPTTLLAPLPGMRYLLKRLTGLVSAPAAGGTAATITYTGSGAAGKIFAIAAPPAASQVATANVDITEGVLADPNTGIAFAVSFNNPFATLMTLDYDIVPA